MLSGFPTRRWRPVPFTTRRVSFVIILEPTNSDNHQAYELSVLTGTQVLLLVVSETGLVYTFTTPKLQPLVTKPEGKNLIQVRSFACFVSASRTY